MLLLCRKAELHLLLLVVSSTLMAWVTLNRQTEGRYLQPLLEMTQQDKAKAQDLTCKQSNRRPL